MKQYYLSCTNYIMEHYYLAPIILWSIIIFHQLYYLAPVILWSIVILHQLYYGALLSFTNYIILRQLYCGVLLSCTNYIMEHYYFAPIILWSIINLLSCTNYAYQELFLVLGLDNAAVVVLFGCRQLGEVESIFADTFVASSSETESRYCHTLS